MRICASQFTTANLPNYAHLGMAMLQDCIAVLQLFPATAGRQGLAGRQSRSIPCRRNCKYHALHELTLYSHLRFIVELTAFASKNNMSKLQGLIAATYTPLTTDGKLNLPQVRPMVEHLLATGADGLFVCGSTGEGMSLTTSERKELTTAFIEAAAGRVPVLIHVGHNSLAEAADLAEHAATAGATAISATSPSYYPITSMDVLVDAMASVAAAAPGTPFYYYHIPVLTGVNLSMSRFLPPAAERIKNLVGLKFTHSAMDEYQRCREMQDGRFDALWGFDEMLLSAMAVGARGAVGSTYNIAARHYRKIIEAFDAGEIEQARRLQAQAVAFIGILAEYSFHSAVKQVLCWQGIDCGPTRLPLPTLCDDSRHSLRKRLDDMGFPEISGVAWASE